MRFPDLANRLVALRACYDADYSALAQRLKVDKTTAWRWVQGAANLPEKKQLALVEGLCPLLAEQGLSVTEADFHLNNTFQFYSRIGISKLRAAILTGVSLPIPESLVDAALDTQEPLHQFEGRFNAHWTLGENFYARSPVKIEKKTDGRMAYRQEWSGDVGFTVDGFLCMIGEELSVVGDRIAGNFRASRSLFTMPLDVDYDSQAKTVKGLQGFMPDRDQGESILRRVVIVPVKLEDVDETTTVVRASEMEAKASGKALSFLKAGNRG